MALSVDVRLLASRYSPTLFCLGPRPECNDSSSRRRRNRADNRAEVLLIAECKKLTQSNGQRRLAPTAQWSHETCIPSHSGPASICPAACACFDRCGSHSADHALSALLTVTRSRVRTCGVRRAIHASLLFPPSIHLHSFRRTLSCSSMSTLTRASERARSSSIQCVRACKGGASDRCVSAYKVAQLSVSCAGGTWRRAADKTVGLENRKTYRKSSKLPRPCPALFGRQPLAGPLPMCL